MLPGVCCPFLSREKKTEEAINDQQPMTKYKPGKHRNEQRLTKTDKQQKHKYIWKIRTPDGVGENSGAPEELAVLAYCNTPVVLPLSYSVVVKSDKGEMNLQHHQISSH